MVVLKLILCSTFALWDQLQLKFTDPFRGRRRPVPISSSPVEEMILILQNLQYDSQDESFRFSSII